MEIDHLIFRRQFMMGPEKIVHSSIWNLVELPEGYSVVAHPDLKMTKVEKGENSVTLLGYVLDPLNPKLTDRDILEQIVTRNLTYKELFDYFEGLTGRYVCISYLHGEYRIFNDPIGFRQVYYCYDTNGKIWSSSQPVMLAERFGFIISKRIENDLFGSQLFRDEEEYWYPGSICLYEEITHLLPNRYIDIKARKQIRFWPDQDLKRIGVDECVENVSVLMEQLFESAHSRFDLEIAVTSGLDSRMILAASRKISDKVQYFTHTHQKLSLSGADIAIPSAMLKQLGLNHAVVFHSDDLDPDFERVFKGNVITARKEKGINAFTMYNHFNNDKNERVVVHGNAGEITRNFYYLPPIVPLNGETLGVLTRMSNSPIAINQFEKWLEEFRSLSKKGIKELDLFYWEQRIANWAAMSYSEYDIAFESFSPFSCRRLLMMMLSVDASLRSPPKFTLHRSIIHKLWPELLQFEINPPKNRSMAFRRKLKKTPMYSVYKSIMYLKYSKIFSKYSRTKM